MQEQEVGDGTNFVIILAGALLEQAEGILRMVINYYNFWYNIIDVPVTDIILWYLFIYIVIDADF